MTPARRTQLDRDYRPQGDFLLRRRALRLWGNTPLARKWLASARHLETRKLWSLHGAPAKYGNGHAA